MWPYTSPLIRPLAVDAAKTLGSTRAAAKLCSAHGLFWSMLRPGHHGSTGWPLLCFERPGAHWPSLEWSLKAPNDLYLEGLKVGGLLVETVSGGMEFRLLIGLGLNILNHPRRFDTAEHLSKSLNAVPEEGDWFQFLDELFNEFKAASVACLQPEMSEASCRELVQALNANSAKPFVVQSVKPNGDITHSKGQIRWTDL